MKSFFTFGEYTVFVTRYLIEKVKKYTNTDFNKIPLEEKIKMNFDKEINDLVFNTLTNEYNTTSKDQFCNKWVRFELEGKEAQEDTLFYIDTYCRFYKNAFLVSESKSYIIETASLMYGNTVSYDGTKFYLSIPGEKRKENLLKKKSTVSRVLIDIEKVVKIVGDYDYFEVIFNNGCKLCLCEDNCVVEI